MEKNLNFANNLTLHPKINGPDVTLAGVDGKQYHLPILSRIYSYLKSKSEKVKVTELTFLYSRF